MQIGIFAKTFEGGSPEIVLRAAAEAGYATVQYNMACSGLPSLPEQISSEQVEAISSAIQNSGVSISALSVTYNMIHPDPRVRKAGLRSLKVLAAVAKTLNIKLLTLCTGSRNPADQWLHHPDNQSQEAWFDLRASMQLALDVAEFYGLYLGIEPEHGNVVNSSSAAKKLIAEMRSSRLKVVFDPANIVNTESAAEQKLLISKSIELVQDHIMLAHAKDRDAFGNVAAAGQGVIDFSHMISGLRAVGYNGPLITHGLSQADAKSVKKFLEGITK
jgi:sugar phosphate isomerase/epimerase